MSVVTFTTAGSVAATTCATGSSLAGVVLPVNAVPVAGELKPEPTGGKLTVSLWLGEKPAVAGKKRKAGPRVEVAA